MEGRKRITWIEILYNYQKLTAFTPKTAQEDNQPTKLKEKIINLVNTAFRLMVLLEKPQILASIEHMENDKMIEVQKRLDNKK